VVGGPVFVVAGRYVFVGAELEYVVAFGVAAGDADDLRSVNIFSAGRIFLQVSERVSKEF